jgi:hypothetical protein
MALKIQVFMSCRTAQHPSSSRVPESYPQALKMKEVRSTETSGITNSAAQRKTSEVLNLGFDLLNDVSMRLQSCCDLLFVLRNLFEHNL